MREKRGAAIPLDVLVDAQAKAAGWPKPEREHRFHGERRWRVDFFWAKNPRLLNSSSGDWEPLALEVEGGVFTGGRHTRGAGFLKDCEKYNTMAAMGIRLIRLTPQQVRRGELQTWLEKMR